MKLISICFDPEGVMHGVDDTGVVWALDLDEKFEQYWRVVSEGPEFENEVEDVSRS